MWDTYCHGRINLNYAKLNLATHFREKSHLRDPAAVDALITFGYAAMHQAEHKYSDWYHFGHYLLPGGTQRADEGVSYLDKVKFQNKSSFLTKFYKGDRPNY